MSNLVVTNVNGQDAQAGKAKAWANFNGKNTVALRNSFNVSSLTDNGTGDYFLNLTNNFDADENYEVNANGAPDLNTSNNHGGLTVAINRYSITGATPVLSSGFFGISCGGETGAQSDFYMVTASAHGDLV